MTVEELYELLKQGYFTGPPGPMGPVGPKGDKGDRGDIGPRGHDGYPGWSGNIGPQGPPGPRGPQGIAGQTGQVGPKGDKGDTGLRGETGIRGPKGESGEHAYELAVRKGFVGSEQQWIESLKGEKGDTGAPGTVEFNELTQEQLEMIKGEQGPVGPMGPRGEKGDRGPQGPEGSKDGLFNHPNGDRIQDANHLNVNGYVLTDKHTNNLPDTDGFQLEEDSKHGVLKFVLESHPKTRNGEKSGVQMFTAVQGTQGGNTYTRNKMNGNWGKWRKVLDSEDQKQIPKDIVTEEKMIEYNKHMERHVESRIDWLDDKINIVYEPLDGVNAGKNGGFLRLGPYGIEWRNSLWAASAGSHKPATVHFNKLQNIFTVQSCICGSVNGSVTFEIKGPNTVIYWGSNDRIYFNTMAIGLAK